jgi:hypothetical protein
MHDWKSKKNCERKRDYADERMRLRKSSTEATASKSIMCFLKPSQTGDDARTLGFGAIVYNVTNLGVQFEQNSNQLVDFLRRNDLRFTTNSHPRHSRCLVTNMTLSRTGKLSTTITLSIEKSASLSKGMSSSLSYPGPATILVVKARPRELVLFEGVRHSG